MEQYKISKDFFKSTVFHVIIIIVIGVVSFLQSRLMFFSPKKISIPKNAIVDSKNHPQSSSQVKANLIDHSMVQQAIKRQELQIAEKINKEKKLEQQAQQVSSLKKAAEQEALKAKQEMQKAREYKKQLEKEYNELQESTKKLKQQAKALSLEQEKLKQQAEAQAKVKALEIEKKKNQKSLANKAEDVKNSEIVDNNNSNNLGFIENEIIHYYAKWKNEIINNRKKIMFLANDMTCAVRIKLLPNGHLALVKIEKSSGNLAYDKFSEQAIYKSAPFEMPQDPALNKELASTEHIIHFDDNSFSD